MQRTGDRALEWDKFIGPSLASFSATQLPIVRTVLQRYRGLRIDNECVPRYDLAKTIATEVMDIWEKARIPTTTPNNTIKKTLGIIDWWVTYRSAAEHEEEINLKLTSLMDLKPMLRGKVSDEGQLEHLKSLMRQTSDVRRRQTEHEQYPDWEVDYNFYIDQFKVNHHHSVIKLLTIVNGHK